MKIKLPVFLCMFLGILRLRRSLCILRDMSFVAGIRILHEKVVD